MNHRLLSSYENVSAAFLRAFRSWFTFLSRLMHHLYSDGIAVCDLYLKGKTSDLYFDRTVVYDIDRVGQAYGKWACPIIDAQGHLV
jgi:hypothetical protein